MVDKIKWLTWKTENSYKKDRVKYKYNLDLNTNTASVDLNIDYLIERKKVKFW